MTSSDSNICLRTMITRFVLLLVLLTSTSAAVTSSQGSLRGAIAFSDAIAATDRNLQPAAVCQDNADFLLGKNKNKKKDCAWINKKNRRKNNKCKKNKVQENCPVTCGTCPIVDADTEDRVDETETTDEGPATSLCPLDEPANQIDDCSPDDFPLLHQCPYRYRLSGCTLDTLACVSINNYSCDAFTSKWQLMARAEEFCLEPPATWTNGQVCDPATFDKDDYA